MTKTLKKAAAWGAGGGLKRGAKKAAKNGVQKGTQRDTRKGAAKSAKPGKVARGAHLVQKRVRSVKAVLPAVAAKATVARMPSAPVSAKGRKGSPAGGKSVPANSAAAAAAAALIVAKGGKPPKVSAGMQRISSDEAVCREVACEGLATSGGYCRLHYIKNWKKIKRKELILKEKKLNQYIEELVAKYPDKYIEAIKQDLAADKDFAKVIHDLDLDEGADEFDVETESVDNLIEGIRRDFEDGDEGGL